MLENNNVITLKRLIPANGKNPNTDYQIIGLEEAISKAITIENNPLKLYFVSQINDILPIMGNPEQYKLNDDTVIGEIVAFNDTTVSFKLIHPFDVEKFENHEILFMYDVDQDHEKKTMTVTSIIYVYIRKESEEECAAWLAEKEEERVALLKPELGIDGASLEKELHDNIIPEDDVVIKAE